MKYPFVLFTIRQDLFLCDTEAILFLEQWDCTGMYSSSTDDSKAHLRSIKNSSVLTLV